ncbi:hypothetical protein IAD21_00765 [Abditibacteriota bacterium]|nr:hypothetical protein IAD21_00765 [Abditibacteriota bacterium]
MYSQITYVGVFLVVLESLILAIGLICLSMCLHHLSLMGKRLFGGDSPVAMGNFAKVHSASESPEFIYHREKAVIYRNAWMICGMIVFMIGVMFFIADGFAVIHLTETVSMRTG